MSLAEKDKIVLIGLEDSAVEKIKARFKNEKTFYVYPYMPKGYSNYGVFRVEHPYILDLFIKPDVVIFYSYFENSMGFRKAIALSEAPSFPDVKKTILHDDKDLSFMICNQFEYENDYVPIDTGVGYVPANIKVKLGNNNRVIKQGNAHCGEGKFLASGEFESEKDSLVESFVEGDSYRVLLILDKAWIIKYESDDWRKNVGGTQTVKEFKEQDFDFGINHIVNYSRQLSKKMGLDICGIDFVLNNNVARFLELNTYPGIPQELEDFFVECLCKKINEL